MVAFDSKSGETQLGQHLNTSHTKIFRIQNRYVYIGGRGKEI
jgi:hypothetical protein